LVYNFLQPLGFCNGGAFMRKFTWSFHLFFFIYCLFCLICVYLQSHWKGTCLIILKSTLCPPPQKKNQFSRSNKLHGTSSKLKVEEILYHVSSFECLDLQTFWIHLVITCLKATMLHQHSLPLKHIFQIFLNFKNTFVGNFIKLELSLACILCCLLQSFTSYTITFQSISTPRHCFQLGYF